LGFSMAMEQMTRRGSVMRRETAATGER